MYVSRQDGESVFGQQIFIRLTGYTDKISFWKTIEEGNRSGWTNLSSDEANSPWNRLYNLANPNSSFNSLLAAPVPLMEFETIVIKSCAVASIIVQLSEVAEHVQNTSINYTFLNDVR